MGDNDHGDFLEHFSTLFIVSVPNIGNKPVKFMYCDTPK